MLDDIARYLQDQGLGTVLTDIFATYVPPTPNSLISVLATGGPEPLEIAGIKSPTFQVFIRNSDYDAGNTKFNAVRNALQATKNTTIGNTFFYYILLISEGGHIGVNPASGFDEWSLNFRCQTR